MTRRQLVDWCKAKQFPMSVAALLYTFDPYEDELDEWSIEFSEPECIINGTTYVLFSEETLSKTLKYIQDKEKASYEVDDELKEFINWEAFFASKDLDSIYKIYPDLRGIQFYNQFFCFLEL